MGKLTADEKRLLDELSAKAAAEDEDYEVWIKNEKGQETRVPFSQGRNWLRDAFGIGAEPAAEGTEGEGGEGDPPADPPARGGSVWGRKG